MKTTLRSFFFVLAVVFAAISFVPSVLAQKKKAATPAPVAASQPIKLVVDATHAGEKILHAEEQIAKSVVGIW